MTLSFSRYLNIRSAHSPVLSPDGRRLAFLSDITGSVQAWSVRVDEPAALDGSTSQPDESAWPHQLTFFEDKVWELHGAGVVDKLIAVSDVGGNERQQLYLIAFEGRAADEIHTVRRLTTNDDAIHRFGAWSRDGRRVLYTSNARNNIDFDLYQADVETGESELLHESQGNRSVAAWSPDGRSVLMADSRAAEQVELYRIDLDSGEEHHLTAGHRSARYGSIHWTDVGIFLLTDRTCNTGAECVLDPETGALDEIVRADDLMQRLAAEDDNVAADARGELDALIATPDGRRVALTLNVEGYSHLIWLDPTTGVMLADLPRGVIGHGSSGSSGLAFGGGGDYLLFELETPTQPVDIWMVNAAGGFMRQLTFSDRAGIDPASFVEPTLVRFPSFDGRELPAHLYLPLTASTQAASAQAEGKAGGRLPCILYVHGGPASQQRPTFDVRFQYFLQQGYALLVPNVRGSTGYGRDYMMLDDVEKRGDSVADLRAAVQWLHTRPEINPDRIAIYGRSYGGFMVLAAMTEYPELFAAGIDVVGIADWVTFLERTSAWRRAHREREYGSLTEHRDVLRQLSPIHKIERIAAPLLVVAGDNDPRVPLYESEQVVEKLEAAGGTVEFLHYADEGHKISKLKNRVDSFTKMAAFLEKYV